MEIKFTFSYSNLRGELYVYDKDDKQVFTVQESEEGADFSTMTNEEIDAYLRKNYMNELWDLCGYFPEQEGKPAPAEPEYQFEIFTKYQKQAWEHCDYATDKKDLDYLLSNYRLAYGADFSFKTKRLKKGNTGE